MARVAGLVLPWFFLSGLASIRRLNVSHLSVDAFALGVGSKQEPALPQVRRSHIKSGKHTPATVIPEAGQSSDDNVGPSAPNGRHIFQEDESRSNLANESFDLEK